MVFEAVVADVLNGLLDAWPTVSFGSYPVLDNPDYKVRITIESRDEDAVAGALSAVTAGFDADEIVRIV